MSKLIKKVPSNMFLAYVDDSGAIHKTDVSENYVLAGFLVNENDWRTLDNALKDLKEQHFLGLKGIEVHTSDIVHAKRQFQKMAPKTRCDFLEAVAELIATSKIHTFAIVMKKHQIANDFVVCEYAHKFLYERISWNVAQLNSFLNTAGGNEQCAIIFFDECSNYNKQFIELVREMVAQGTEYQRNEKIIEDPIFTNSKWRGNIQIADTIAYVFNYFNKAPKKNLTMHTALKKVYDAALSKMRDPNPDYPARCYKIWPT